MSNIPTLPQGQVVDEKGVLLPNWKSFFVQLINELNNGLSNEGYRVPQQPTTTINQLNTSESIGALLYDSTTNQLKVNIDGTFRVVTVT